MKNEEAMKYMKGIDQGKLGRRMKKVLLVMEMLMSIPLIAWTLVSFTGFPVFFLLFFHTFSLVLAHKTNASIKGNVIGIFGGFLSIIPVIGWCFHVTISIILYRDLARTRKRKNQRKADVITIKAK